MTSDSKKTLSKQKKSKSKSKSKSKEVIPHCPECKFEFKNRNDIKQDYFYKLTTASYRFGYCSNCGCVLGFSTLH